MKKNDIHINDVTIPRISRGMMRKTLQLLYMEYKPSEIAEIMGIITQTIYTTYIPAGLPHRRDEKGRIWIVGTEFREWAESVLQKSLREKVKPMAPDEGYCVSCKQRVKMTKAKRSKKIKENVIQILGKCALCGGTVSRFAKLSEEK